jgi:asparagine synthase (glutamine-hydrolysing)
VEMAVARRMIADVPLGAFLSGGIDSSAVVAAMARQSSGPVKTFSIGFVHTDFNELPYARRVAQAFSTDHHEFIVEPSAVEILPKLVRHYGEPFADSSAIPSFYLAELTRRHVTVALNGDGGDEAFGGYGRYVWNSDSLVAKLGKLPLRARRAVAGLVRQVRAGAPHSFRWRVHQFGRLLDLTPRENYERAMSFFDRYERQKLYTPGYCSMIGESLVPSIIQTPWERASGEALIDLMLETDVETYLPGDLLVKMDIATMAHSLEARSPLLDHQLLEMAAKLPARLKVSGSEKKIVFRDALTAWLPRSLLDRPKMGFGVPLKHWFRDELRDYAADVLLDGGTLARGYFERPYLESLLAEHRAGTMDHSSRMWALIMAELWHRQYVDAPKTLVAVGA